jgi:hypothetical protein
VHVFQCQHHRLNLRTGHHPCDQRRQLSAAQFLRRQGRRAILWQLNVKERGE